MILLLFWTTARTQAQNPSFGKPSAADGFKAILPTLSGQANKYFQVNGTATDITFNSPAGTGDMLAANNLSDLADAATARTNLGIPVSVTALASNAAANATTGMVEITGLNRTVGAGTYHFKYVVRAQSSATATSLKFAVNHTGTTTVFLYSLYYPSVGVTASTGVVDMETNPTTGSVWAHASTRAKNTTLGPQTDIDVQNADIMFLIEGMMTVTVSGDLELYHGSETAASTQVMTGTALILTKLL